MPHLEKGGGAVTVSQIPITFSLMIPLVFRENPISGRPRDAQGSEISKERSSQATLLTAMSVAGKIGRNVLCKFLLHAAARLPENQEREEKETAANKDASGDWGYSAVS